MRRWATTISGEKAAVLYYQPPLGHRETTCHLCLREAKLSWEHVPPQSAFNDDRRLWERFNPRAKGIGDDGRLIGPPQTRLDTWQAGFKVRTLCEDCNKATGRGSAKEYVRFVKYLAEAPRLLEPCQEHATFRVRADTLLLARQIAVMILAIEDVRFARLHDELRRFARGEIRTVAPPCRVLAFLVPDLAAAGTIVRSHGRVDLYGDGTSAIAGEISLYPFGFVYAFELGAAYRSGELADITHWFAEDGPERHHRWLGAPRALTVLDSLHAIFGNPRHHPQIDTVPEPGS